LAGLRFSGAVLAFVSEHFDHRAVKIGSHEGQQQSNVSSPAVPTHEPFHRPSEGGGGEIGEVDADADPSRLNDFVALISGSIVLQ